MKKFIALSVMLGFLIVPVLALAQAPASLPSGLGQQAAPTTTTGNQNAAKFLSPEQTKQLQDALKNSASNLSKNSAVKKTFRQTVWFMVIWLIICIALFAFWLWMLIDLLMSEFSAGIDKAIWVFVVITLMPLGALLYLIIGRPRKRAA